VKMGQTIDLNKLTVDILGIEGINKIFTRREDINVSVEGLRFLSWNAAYGDISSQNVVSNITLEDFQFPHFAEDVKLQSKIIVETNRSYYEGVDV
jgi:hypothetical protein